MKKLYWVGNSKGGVGKSTVTMALLDALERAREDVLLVESDTSNPDVMKTYGKMVEAEALNLDEADGWIELVNVCAAHRERTVVVNTPARSNTGLLKFGPTLEGILPELERQLVMLWVATPGRDSLELLPDFMDVFPSAMLHVVRNAFFGEENKFALYNGSKTRETIEARGGKTLNFPVLADRVAHDINAKRLPISRALEELPIGHRAELLRWRREIDRMLAEVLA